MPASPAMPKFTRIPSTAPTLIRNNPILEAGYLTRLPVRLAQTPSVLESVPMRRFRGMMSYLDQESCSRGKKLSAISCLEHPPASHLPDEALLQRKPTRQGDSRTYTASFGMVAFLASLKLKQFLHLHNNLNKNISLRLIDES